jgi:hypothetical protein
MGVTLEPFWHTVIDGFFGPDLLRDVVAEIPSVEDPRWHHYDNSREGKFEGGPAMWGPATHELATVIASGPFAAMLTDLTGIEGLSCEFEGGGYHLIPPGGRLAVHADFNRSPSTYRYRRLNVLIYLNENWTDADGGLLELWDANGPAVEILPVFDRMVIFKTSSTSFHGHPVPLPGPRNRCSFAAYFFTETPSDEYTGQDHSTVFHAQ